MRKKEILKFIDKASESLQKDLESSKKERDMEYFQTVLDCLSLIKQMRHKIVSCISPSDSEDNHSETSQAN